MAQDAGLGQQRDPANGRGVGQNRAHPGGAATLAAFAAMVRVVQRQQVGAVA